MYPRALIVGSLALLAATDAWGQEPGPVATAEASIIEVTGRASESIPPDAVTVRFLVTSIKRNPDAAAEEVDTKAAGVVAALDALGIADLETSRVGYGVGPQWEFDENRNRQFTGYLARITIRAETGVLPATGRVVQAAITSGAREVNRIQYTSSRMDDARRSALSAAVRAAQFDASAMAEAAGGTLGRLLLLSTQSRQPSPRAQAAAALAVRPGASPEITPEELTVSAQVHSRWEFVPASDSGNP